MKKLVYQLSLVYSLLKKRLANNGVRVTLISDRSLVLKQSTNNRLFQTIAFSEI